MAEPTRRESPWGDIFEWFEEAFPSRFRRPLVGAYSMRVEEFTEGDTYVLRAELPGVDPERDVEITVDNGILTVKAERREEQKDVDRSEFHYGLLVREVSLPQDADEERVDAGYRDGILEIRVGMRRKEEKPAPRRIPIGRSPAD